MSEDVVSFSDLVRANLLEVGAGRPRSAGLDRLPLPILRVADVAEGGVLPSFQMNTPVAVTQDLGPKISKPGDVVLTTKGTVGRVAIMPSNGPTYAYSPQLCYFRPIANGPLRARYLYYWFKSDEFWKQANALKGQTDMADFISLSDLYSIRMRLPSTDKQVAVVCILGALDDKIAVNRRIVENVDRLLAVVFDSISVDAKHETLRTIAEVNRSVVKPNQDGFLRYLDIASVATGAYEFPPVLDWGSAPGRARRAVHAGDTVWSTVRPGRRSHALILDDDPTLVASTGLAVLSPHEGRIAGLYESSRRTEFLQYLESVAEGSAYPAVNASRFAQAPVPGLSDEAWDRFESTALPLRRRAHAAVVENRGLEAARDELLPLLVSGKLTVKDAELLVEEVV